VSRSATFSSIAPLANRSAFHLRRYHGKPARSILRRDKVSSAHARRDVLEQDRQRSSDSRTAGDNRNCRAFVSRRFEGKTECPRKLGQSKPISARYVPSDKTLRTGTFPNTPERRSRAEAKAAYANATSGRGVLKNQLSWAWLRRCRGLERARRYQAFLTVPLSIQNANGLSPGNRVWYARTPNRPFPYGVMNPVFERSSTFK
jgi:hypothetical protein